MLFAIPNKSRTKVREEAGITDLMRAARNNNAELLIKLLTKGNSNIDAQTEAGWTALMFAAHNGHSRMVDILLNYGADKYLTSKDGRGATAMYLALAFQHVNVIKRFLAEPNFDIPVSALKDLCNPSLKLEIRDLLKPYIPNLSTFIVANKL